MDEKALLTSIADFAKLTGWTVAHFPKVPVKYPGQPVRWTTPIRYDGKGFLDLLLLRERIMAVEIKAREKQDHGYKVTPEQQAWIDRWHMVGVAAYVWTLSDWPEVAQAELTRRQRYVPSLPTMDYDPA